MFFIVQEFVVVKVFLFVELVISNTFSKFITLSISITIYIRNVTSLKKFFVVVSNFLASTIWECTSSVTLYFKEAPARNIFLVSLVRIFYRTIECYCISNGFLFSIFILIDVLIEYLNTSTFQTVNVSNIAIFIWLACYILIVFIFEFFFTFYRVASVFFKERVAIFIFPRSLVKTLILVNNIKDFILFNLSIFRSSTLLQALESIQVTSWSCDCLVISF